MLYPQENTSRAVMSLSGLWKFCLDDGNAEKEKWQECFPKKYDLLYVPGSYNDQKEDPKFRTHRGVAFYEQEFTVPKFWNGQRLVLRFDAVTHNAIVWIDGKELCRHRGGFLPFETEITDLVTPGESFRVTVSADNTIGHNTLPVGNEGGTAFFGSDNEQVPAVQAAKRWREPVNLPNFDFFNYAGIQRPVRIYTTPRSYIDDISIVPSYQTEEDGSVTGSVCFEVKVCGDFVKENTLSVSCKDREGNIVCTLQAEVAEGKASGRMEIRDCKLWEPYPGDPYLYEAVFSYGEDVYVQEIGIRTVRVEGTKFLINEKPFYFKGCAKHEDFFLHGRGMDELLNVKDISLFHWLNANSFRTSHYPYAEEMYRLCDREGIVIIDETPAVGIGAGKAQDPYKTFPLKDYHEKVIRDMIQRDQNHPCVVMWSMGNEPDTENFPESALAYWSDLYEITHAADPQNRPVTFVCCQNDYTRDLVTRTMDVVCINRYYGWYNLSGDLDAACYAWNLELDFWEEQNKPVMITEYGADTIEGLHGTNGEMFTEEFQCEYYRRIDAEFDKREFFIGEHCWCFADFGTLQGTMRADGNRKGIFTRTRRPKAAAHMLRKRWEEIPNFFYKP